MLNWLKRFFGIKQKENKYWRVAIYDNEIDACKQAFKLYGERFDGVNARVRKVPVVNGVQYWAIESLWL